MGLSAVAEKNMVARGVFDMDPQLLVLVILTAEAISS
jgi:hypothetical protein